MRSAGKLIPLALLLSACASTPVDEWRWRIANADLYSSRIVVDADGRKLATIDLACDLRNRDSAGEDEGSAPRIEVIRSTPYPNGLLLVRCPTGAHSALIAAFDPVGRGDTPVFKRTGHYFADWRTENGVAIVSYDVACDDPAARCAMQFKAVEETIELQAMGDKDGRIIGLQHLAINVHSLEEARQFYGELLGLVEIPRPDAVAEQFRSAWFRLGNGELHVVENPEFKPLRSPLGPHFAVACDDFAAVSRRLARHTDAVVFGPKAGIDGIDRIVLRDGTGNIVEIIDLPLGEKLP